MANFPHSENNDVRTRKSDDKRTAGALQERRK